MEEEKDQHTTPPRKYSRYRSVRQEATKLEPATVPVQDHGVARSMSRYRRPKAPRTDLLNSPPVPSIPIARLPNTGPSPARDGVRRVTESIQSPPKQQIPTRHDTVAGCRVRETETERERRKAMEALEREAQREIARKEREAKERRDAIARAEQARLDEEEAARLLAEQKRKDLERLEKELDAAGPPPQTVTSPGRERLGFFSRKRSGTKATSPSTEGSNSLSMSRSRSNTTPPAASNEPSFRVMEQPKTDAPISAVNAGERRVLIRCKQSSINLPITPETTPMDLIYSAANIMTQNITVSTAILLESYTKLGLERRIRRYEHIRDIMNSWDRDTQNALTLQNSDSPNHDHDLETRSVPREAPKEVSVHMYHSQKPGKWNKRYITLLSSGQIFMSKKPKAKPSDKDVLNLCHLSDFDIYTPTPQQLRKVLKPPKKHCYAIKSQQKTNMFLSTENFVHFFNTDDESLAEAWYNAVQRWRSWYLVNRMGEGAKKSKKTDTEIASRPATKAGPTHRIKGSVDEDPYTIGSFKPLLNLDRFSPRPQSDKDPDYDSEDENRPRQIPFHLRHSIVVSPTHRGSKHHPPPVSYRLPPEANGDDEFASSGLLGRTYSQRQKATKEREATSIPGNPFVDGPSLLNSHGPETTALQRPETSAGPSSGGGLNRNSSKREKPKPLLDFTPQFKEPPQWSKEGKGHGVLAPSGVPLVEVATTPEMGLNDIAKGMGTMFKRPTTAERGEKRPTTAGARIGHAHGHGEEAFVKGGLVSGI